MSKPINPDHYAEMAIEPIDVIESCKMNYNVASATAYLMRAGRKGDRVSDLKKALNFLHREVYGVWFQEPVQAVPEVVSNGKCTTNPDCWVCWPDTLK